MISPSLAGRLNYYPHYKTDAPAAFTGVPLTVCSTRMEVILEC